MTLAKVLKRYEKAYASEMRKGILRAYNESTDLHILVLFDPMSGQWRTTAQRTDQKRSPSKYFLIETMSPWRLTDLSGITHDGRQYLQDGLPIDSKKALEYRDKILVEWMPQYCRPLTREHFRKKIIKFWEGRQK